MSIVDNVCPTGMTRRTFLSGVLATGAVLPVSGFSKNVRKKRPICVFSKHLQWCNYKEMAETAAGIGFDGIDLTVRPGGHVSPTKVEENLPKAVEAVRKAGLDVYMMTTAINDPTDPTTELVLKTASKLGIRYYRMGYLKYNDSVSVAKNLENLKPVMADLAEMNKSYNIHGAYQNHAGTRVGGPVWDLWHLLNGLDPRWMGCQYDVRHATLEGGYSWPLGMELLSDYIKITAIKDFVWAKVDGKWKAKNVALGKGMVDFTTYFELVKKLGVNGPISLHYEYPLGGADHGHRKLTIPKVHVLQAMKKDLTLLRSWIKDAQL